MAFSLTSHKLPYLVTLLFLFISNEVGQSTQQVLLPSRQIQAQFRGRDPAGTALAWNNCISIHCICKSKTETAAGLRAVLCTSEGKSCPAQLQLQTSGCNSNLKETVSVWLWGFFMAGRFYIQHKIPPKACCYFRNSCICFSARYKPVTVSAWIHPSPGIPE